MASSRSRLTNVALSVAMAVALLGGWFACTQQESEITGPQSDVPAALLGVRPAALASLIQVQERQTDNLLALPGVVGTAVGLTADGRPAIKIYTRSARVAGIPLSLEGAPVVVEQTGDFHTMELRAGRSTAGVAPLSNPTRRFGRPVPTGVSTGNAGECSAGTIAARVKKPNGDVFALSNNHVYGLENSANIGSNVLQPGRFDTNCATHAGDVIGTLADFQPINFSPTANNKIDAAIAATSTANLRNSTPADGYGRPFSSTMAASVGQDVQKFGRTTKLTHGEISGVNATVLIGYSSGPARFVKQIIVSTSGPFIQPGDSGSLLVTDPGRRPVGLLFAANGPGTFSIANRIDLVLKNFGVTIDGQ
ncbi:MAG TPA: hypothetical protein VIC59_06055 [Gemmatimonadota bacterium]|jgi:hypothetical protein